MTHYYTEKPDSKSNERTLHYEFERITYQFISDHSVFSKDHIDTATDILLRSINVTPQMKKGLDLGCGYGVIGTVLTKQFHLEMTLSDVNERALALSRKNLVLNNVEASVIKSEGFDNLNDQYDLIVSNPPIRIGKQPLYNMFENAVKHLNDAGEFWIVMHKKHGALSALKHLRTFSTPEVLKKDKGFHVIVIKKH